MSEAEKTNPISVGIITGALVFIALLQASIIVSGQTLSLSTVASGQNLYSSIDVRGISLVALFFGSASAIAEILWPGTGKEEQLDERGRNRWEREEDEEMRKEQQESLDDFEET